MSDLVLVPENAVARPGEGAHIGHALDLFYSGRSDSTIKAYRSDLDALAKWSGRPVASVLDDMVRGSAGEANLLAMRWRATMVDEGKSPATINRRLAALRSILAVARTIGVISWSLDVSGVKSEAYRDTRGPSLNETEAILSAIRRETGAISVRNEAMVRLMLDMALRRQEVARLDVTDVDLDGNRLWVLGKGKREPVPLTMPGPTKAAVKAWLAFRPASGALFVEVDRHGKQYDRITGSGIYHVVTAPAQRAGVTARPHGLRHGSITRALDLTKGDVRAVRMFSRHAKVETVLKYDDARSDMAGEVASMVADSISRREA